MALPIPNVTALLKDINEKGGSVVKNGEDQQAQKALLESARNLVATLESPFEVLARMSWFEPSRFAMARIGIDVNLYEAMLSNNGSSSTVETLAEKTGCDPKLLSRMLKHLAAARFVEETAPDEYAPNGITAALATRIPAGMVKNCFHYNMVINAKLVDYMKNTRYRNPTNKDATPWKFGMGTDLHYFDWVSLPENAQELENLKAHMEFKTLGKKWFQSVDVQEIFNHPTDPEATLMIDIGGSFGHDIIDFHKAFPDLPGKLILQELPSVIQSLPEEFPKDIQAQAYDAFTPQPIHHAKAYYLHMVLHDWPDESCRKILSSLIPAMKRGYSKILLNEIVIPDMGASWFSTSVDMIMLLCHAAQERTEKDWTVLVESVGLKIAKIWDCEGNPEKILEIELA